MVYEQTIRSAVECSGVGLHNGAPVRMRILPAAAGTGIVFRRTDLDDFTVEATGRNVAKVSYATSLMKKGVLISTTEHLLSALMGLGVDNAIIELDNLEVPILDGSALPIVEMLRQAGLRNLRRPRRYLQVIEEVEVVDGAKRVAISPDESFSVAYTIDFPAPIGRSSIDVDLSSGYTDLIAPARTFGFLEDVPVLQNMGLIRGATEENAIVVTREGVKNPPLRFADEFVRHKVLDLVGDLALLGHPVLGRVVADRAGHAMHTALVQKLLKTPALWRLVTREEAAMPALQAAP